MQRWAVASVYPIDYQENFLRQLTDITLAGDGMLEEAARLVVALGYDPRTDCLLEVRRDVASVIGRPFHERKRLLVRGEPFFEVVTTSQHDENSLVINFTITPRLLNSDLRAKENPADSSEGRG